VPEGRLWNPLRERARFFGCKAGLETVDEGLTYHETKNALSLV